jgi:peptide deformylase
MEIVKAPDPILKIVCEPVTMTNPRVQDFAGLMVHKLLKVGGLGLAAPQVGQAIRLFVMKQGNQILVCFNPEITRRGKDTATDVEGCLSIPGKRFRVVRNKICDLTYTAMDGQRHTIKLKGLEARCAQHEMDHLNGILIG